MAEPQDRMQVLTDFITELDTRFGGMRDDELDGAFTEFGEETQPELMGLFLAIVDDHKVEIEFVNECAFLLLGLFLFYEERLDLSPPSISRKEVLRAIDQVDALFDKLGPRVDSTEGDDSGPARLTVLDSDGPGSQEAAKREVISSDETAEMDPTLMDPRNFPILEMEVPGLYSRIWEGCLVGLLEEGSIDEDMMLDLFKFYLVVVTCLAVHVPDVRVTPN